MTKIIYLLLLLIILPVEYGYCDDVGYKYYQKGEFDKAYDIWTKELEDGEPKAYFNIALLYFFGNGVKKDLYMAFDYCEIAAYKGLPRAQNNLAYMHLKGLGTEKNYLLAYAWSKIAIENGYNSQLINDDAIINLTPAMMYDANEIYKEIRREIVDGESN
tara:strand:+ start:43 stop:522 length:480 start_codon:yes stop_codon:yes gene_type:complete